MCEPFYRPGWHNVTIGTDLLGHNPVQNSCNATYMSLCPKTQYKMYSSCKIEDETFLDQFCIIQKDIMDTEGIFGTLSMCVSVFDCLTD